MSSLKPHAETVDHGGGIDQAMALWGGARGDWVDLSTGINPVPYPLPPLPAHSWAALPDKAAFKALEQAARSFWAIPDQAQVIAAPGASALIARMPDIAPAGRVSVPAPTYNEHARAFRLAGREVTDGPSLGDVRVLVHPNNPDGRLWQESDIGGALCIIDESFGEITPAQSLIAHSARDGVIVLKSFGKFWGLAGVRLGFAIGTPATFSRLGRPLAELIGPWAVSGPALAIGTLALQDQSWAQSARLRLNADAQRLDRLLETFGATVAGGTDLFRLYHLDDAQSLHDRLARHKILSRIFPYSQNWLRLGLPAPDDWARLEKALA